jgi:hypothetical protein
MTSSAKARESRPMPALCRSRQVRRLASLPVHEKAVPQSRLARSPLCAGHNSSISGGSEQFDEVLGIAETRLHDVGLGGDCEQIHWALICARASRKRGSLGGPESGAAGSRCRPNPAVWPRTRLRSRGAPFPGQSLVGAEIEPDGRSLTSYRWRRPGERIGDAEACALPELDECLAANVIAWS